MASYEIKFPFEIDKFERFIDPDLESQAIIKQVETLQKAGRLAEATELINRNPKLQSMIFTAANMNMIYDTITNIETFCVEDYHNFVMNVVQYKGAWNGSTKYKKFDVVSYARDGAIESFSAVTDNIPIGTLPTNTNYWEPRTIRGEQGASGAGMSPRGLWSNITQYYQYDCCAFENRLWYAKKDNLNAPPSSSPDDWGILMELQQQVITSAIEPSGQDVGDIWLQPAVETGGFTVHVKENGNAYSHNYLATLVDGKIPEEQLPMTGGTIVSTTAPENTKLTWIDISLGENMGIQKYWNGTAWVPAMATWG